MAICRVELINNYTIIPNYHIDDKRLSLKAAGLLTKMLRLPDDWDYTIEGLAAICGQDGKASIRSAIKELEDAGYVVRRQLHDDSGAFAGNEYTIYQMPHNPDGTPLSENCTTVPLSDFPSSGNALSGNRTQPITNIPSTNLPIPPKAPRGGRQRREPKAAPDWQPERFAKFWELYPRGESKQAAIAAWDKLTPDDETLKAMAQALLRQMSSEEWQRGVGIPYAATYLNQRRWEDPVKSGIPQPSSEGGGLRRW